MYMSDYFTRQTIRSETMAIFLSLYCSCDSALLRNLKSESATGFKFHGRNSFSSAKNDHKGDKISNMPVN